MTTKIKTHQYTHSTKQTDKYITGIDRQVRKNKYCSRLIALRQVEAPYGEGAGMSENPISRNFFFALKIPYPITKMDDFVT